MINAIQCAQGVNDMNNGEDIILNPEEAANYLKVNPQTIYRNLRRGRLPGGKVGNQWRIRKSDLDRFLAGAAFTENVGRNNERS